MQNIKMACAIAAVGFTVLMGGRAPAEAAPLSASPLGPVSQQVAEQNGGALQQVHYRARRYCRNWRSECAERWNWHTPRYRLCLRRHDCL
jgi:hypothetical protein